MRKIHLLLLATMVSIGCGAEETKPPVSTTPKATPIATPVAAPVAPVATPAPPAHVYADPVVVPRTRVFPAAIDISEAALPQRIEQIVLSLNVLDNEDRRTNGEQLAALPASAVPIMKKMLERENLSWVALASLNKAIELIEHREAGKQMSDVEAASLAWAREMYVESYKRHGKRSPLWDQHVIEGLEWWAIYVANIPTRHEGLPIQIYHLMLKAKNAGCEDGLVQHCMMNLFPLMGALPPAKIAGDKYWGYELAAQRLEPTDYPPLIKAWAYSQAAQRMHVVDANTAGKNPFAIEPSAKALEYFNKSFEFLKQALAQGPIPEHALLAIIDHFLTSAAELQRNRDEWFARIKPLMAQHYANTGLIEAAQSAFMVRWAWDARGTGFINTVTQDGAKLFHERLQSARPFLLTAMEKYPQHNVIPQNLMVCLFADDYDQTLFDKGLKSYARGPLGQGMIFTAIMNYLEPKWGGNEKRMIHFARQALLTGNWEDRLPYILVETHMTLARLKAPDYNSELLDHPNHFNNPEVWADMQVVCENMLKWHPDDPLVMTAYLYAACGAEKWELAQKLFEQLGTRAHYRYIRNPNIFASMKNKVQRMVKPVRVTADMIATDDKIRELLVKFTWHMDFFNPGDNIRKQITWKFSADGKVTARLQPNWKVENGVLNTFSADRKQDARWKFNLAQGRWDNLNNVADNPEKQYFLFPVAE